MGRSHGLRENLLLKPVLVNGEITWLKGKSSFKACAAIIEKKD